MPRAGTFGGLVSDPEVFADYMAEQPTWSNAIIAPGILQDDDTIMDLIGAKGNVATLPFCKPISIDDYEPLNNNSMTDNTSEEVEGGKQTAMLIQCMKAWKAKDFTKDGCHFSKMYLARKICICYNASRQKDMNSPCRTAKSPSVAAPGLFYSLFWNGRVYGHRLVTGYSSLSNHLHT